MTFDPGKVASDLEHATERIDKGAGVYQKAVHRFEEAEEAFELAMTKARLEADAQVFAATGKYPSKERRHDIALKAVQAAQSELYVEYFAAKADKEAQAVLSRHLLAAVSSRQSLARLIAP